MPKKCLSPRAHDRVNSRCILVDNEGLELSVGDQTGVILRPVCKWVEEIADAQGDLFSHQIGHIFCRGRVHIECGAQIVEHAFKGENRLSKEH